MKTFLYVKLLVFALLVMPACAQTNPWKTDLEKVYQLVMEQSGHIFQHYEQDAWEKDYWALVKKSPTLSKEEIRVRLMKLVASLRDGHSGIWIRDMVMPQEDSPWFPIRMYYFQEGLYVIAADAQYASCIGGKVERIGHFAETEASQMLFALANGENEYGDKLKAPFLMIYPPILKGLGVIDDQHTLPLQIRLSDGTLKQVRVAAQMYAGGIGGFFDQFESPSQNSVRLDRKLGREWASTKWQIAPPYVVDYREAEQVLYVKLNVLRDPPGHSLTDTFTALWEIVENQPVRKLILDLRNNGGGNLNNAWPFIFRLKQYPHLNQENKLIVLTGRKTFSAATAFMSMLETHTQAVFIGEPSSGRPNQTEGTNVFPPPVLAHIEVDVMLSRGKWTHTHPLDDRDFIVPDVMIPESIQDWMEGRDHALEAALQLK